MSRESEIAVVGGGLVGSAIAYGLARLGREVLLVDEGDVAFRASRGNFGLVWVQGKGLTMPEYNIWSQRSAELWRQLAAELAEIADVDVGLSQPGGALIAMSEAELDGFKMLLSQLDGNAGDRGFKYEILDHDGLAELIPGLGPTVPGGTYTPYDGHVNPLKMLRGLHVGFRRRNGRYLANAGVTEIEEAPGGGFRLVTAQGTVGCEKLVIAAGLGSNALCEKIGVGVEVSALHGQLLITERSPQRLDIPTNIIRKTDEGTFQVGYSKDDLGMTTETRVDLLRDIALNAVRALPYLADLRLVRTWAALRIMTRDGCPIYQQSPRHPGAFVFTCHSGVTLGAVHALVCPEWIVDGAIPESYSHFSQERFNVQAA